MPINISNYVQITSGVGGAGAVRQRDLISRVFTQNPLVPTGGVVEFTSAAEVGDYFGTDSEEYARASFYFSWVSKNITSPQKISFSFWAATATAPRIYGDPAVVQTLGSWTSISSGSFYLTLGENSDDGPDKILLSGLNFTAAGSLAAVAAVIQSAVRSQGSQALWASATVTYDATRGTFNLVGGSTGDAAVAIAVGPSGDIAAQLGWLSAGTILSDGSAAKTLTSTLDSSVSNSNNFGSFLFITQLNPTQVEEVAAWTDLQNVMFMYLLPALNSTTANTYWTELQDYSGVGVSLSPTTGQYAEMIPGIIMAATRYAERNSVQNFMYQTNFSGLDASVTDTATAQAYDNIRTNYYGNTQTAGQILTFYQRGTLMGGTTDPVDQNVFANEIWLKDAAESAIMTLLLSLAVVSANKQGQAQVLSVLQSAIDAALFNGTISPGKPLTTTQKLFITQITGSDKAWYQVQNIGYWVNAVIESFVTEDSRTEYKIVYTLIYSKDDAVRKVEGRHILI